MTIASTLDKKFFKRLLSIPSAPYREKLILEELGNFLSGHGVPFFSDPAGNLVVGAKSESDYKRKLATGSEEPLRIFIAHTDHPGFHGVAWDKKGQLELVWHGGSPTHSLEGARMWVCDQSGGTEFGKLTAVKMHKSKLWLETAKVKGLKKLREKAAGELFGGFAFRSPLWSKGSVYYTKAADDLVGSFVIASVAVELWKNRSSAFENFIGLLTRAEEVGFIGCLAHFELGWLKQSKRPLLGVSLETSRTLPGAIVGQGPVVRLGDRASIFDPRGVEVLSQLAAKKLPKRFQRRIMDGGTCEGTVVTVFGIPCIALSIPLGNYHNQNFEGGPDSRGPKGKGGPAPEFVHWKDVEGMSILCDAVMEEKLPWNAPFAPRREGLQKRLADASGLLKTRW